MIGTCGSDNHEERSPVPAIGGSTIFVLCLGSDGERVRGERRGRERAVPTTYSDETGREN